MDNENEWTQIHPANITSSLLDWYDFYADLVFRKTVTDGFVYFLIKDQTNFILEVSHLYIPDFNLKIVVDSNKLDLLRNEVEKVTIFDCDGNLSMLRCERAISWTPLGEGYKINGFSGRTYAHINENTHPCTIYSNNMKTIAGTITKEKGDLFRFRLDSSVYRAEPSTLDDDKTWWNFCIYLDFHLNSTMFF